MDIEKLWQQRGQTPIEADTDLVSVEELTGTF